MSMQIRKAINLDSESIKDVHRRAFPDSENQLVARLAVNLLDEKTNPETFSLIAEVDKKMVGHIGFSPLFIESNQSWIGYILAPLAVIPGYQKRGIGSKLIHAGIQQLADQGVNRLFVYGDPDYYGRFGFESEAAFGFLPPYPLEYSFAWQAMALNPLELINNNVYPLICVESLRDPKLW